MTPAQLQARARRRLLLLLATLASLPVGWALGSGADVLALMGVAGAAWGLRRWTLAENAWRWSAVSEAWRARMGLDALSTLTLAGATALGIQQSAIGAAIASAIAMLVAIARGGWTQLEIQRIAHHAALEDRTGAQLPWSVLEVTGPWVEALESGERLEVAQGASLETWGTAFVGVVLMFVGTAGAPWTLGKTLALWAPGLAALGWAWVRRRQESVRLRLERAEPIAVTFQGETRALAWGAVLRASTREGASVVTRDGEEIAVFVGESGWLEREIADLTARHAIRP